jgi:hypothetical protein
MSDAERQRLEDARRRTTSSTTSAGARMADDLYQRYMAADRALRDHADTCTACTPEARCTAGAALFETFSRLQDAYLNRPHNKA